MKRVAKGFYRLLRLVVVTLLVVPVLLFVGSYVALSVPGVQNRIKHEGEKALSEYLNTPVTINDITIKPFNQVVLGGVNIPDQQGDSLLHIEKLGAGIDIYRLLADGRVVVTYGEIIGLHGRVTRPDKDSPTNLQFIIDAFKPKDDQPPKPFDVQVRNVVVRKSDLTYDVLDAIRKSSGVFDPNHIAISELKADVDLPRLKNNDFDIQIKRLAFNERSGFVLEKLQAQALVTDTALRVSNVSVELPRSNVWVDEVSLAYSSLKNLGAEIKTMPLSLDIKNNVVTPADFKAFVPSLATWDDPLTISASLSGNFDEVHIPVLKLNDAQGQLAVNVKGYVGRLQSPADLTYDFRQLKLKASALEVGRVVSAVGALSPQARGIITRCGDVVTDVALSGNTSALRIKGDISTSLGSVQLDGKMANLKKTGEKQFSGHVATEGLNLGTLLDKHDFGSVALNADASVSLKNKVLNGKVDGYVQHFDFKGRRYNNIDADIVVKGNDYEGHLAINDEVGCIVLDGNAHIDGPSTRIQAVADVKNVRPSTWGVLKKYPQQTLSLKADMAFVGNSLDNATGSVLLSDINFVNNEDKGIHLDSLLLEADNSSIPQSIDLTSDYFAGHVSGRYHLKTLIPSVKTMLSKSFPQYFSAYIGRTDTGDNFQFDFTLNPDEELQSFLKLPVKVVHTTTLNGFMDASSGNMQVNIDAPYLLQGNKIIEGTSLEARIDSATHVASLHASSLVPSKNGKISLSLDATGMNDRLDANVGWRVMREQNFSGDLNVSALLKRNENRTLDATIDINPTQVVFNDTAWQVEHARVHIDDGVITVENLNGHNENQWIRINGKASRNPDDELCLELNDMSLDYIFETLNIDNVDFGGRATGRFYASDLFSGAPRLSTPGLHVDNLSYNEAVMGDADIKSSWLNDEKAVSLYADLDQDNGEHSIIDGAIFVTRDSLYLEFDANKVNVSFLKPFMAAFTSDVRGEASGHATLLGNFHTINLDGDIKVDSLTFKLDYTNVYYTCSNESIHIVPDYIAFDQIRIHDRDGHEAMLGGWLRHDSFHAPSFEFNVTDAKNLLSYDTNESINPRWYGTVYGNGAAFVTGEPGQVDIKVNMTTAPNSAFTFVLSNSEEASDYKFITFRDRDKKDVPVDSVVSDTIPEILRRLTAQVQQQEQSAPTHYTIDLQGDITPEAQLVLVMDPVGGDRVKARGSGSMRMTYNDADELTVYGTYTLERGNYNFTLQDIIIKDFTIRDGSSITFQGNPYAAVLDLEAVYSLNANLRDLDESFAQDREITRTNVPVHALLRAKGVMSQPDISFDLEFPTLTTDAYRKVKSIISTDDMMNRQIIYLLALNRFYTPDYMNVTNRGNELSSVASSTISSQLSSMLGKMSDKWTISPNFRSNKGDFSDMEVDLALSSQLLNNRLLLNGNFGYRDNTYNTRNTNFIGDFDIEYLLNPKGTLRLKAYNHFNDQNYYVRNAVTTQGVGVVWKHDFDRPFDFLRPKLKPTTATSLPADSVKTDSTTLMPVAPSRKE